MRYKRLFIFVEGDDDEIFFNRLITPIFEKKYEGIKVIKYAQKPKKWRADFLKSIKSMNADYIYVADINDKPCVTAKKQEIQKELKNIDENRIIIVIMEIESWYFAGLDNPNAKKLEIDTHLTTDNITKEEFNGLILKRFDSKIDFISEIIRSFSIEIAKQKNNSFKYFVGKYIEM